MRPVPKARLESKTAARHRTPSCPALSRPGCGLQPPPQLPQGRSSEGPARVEPLPTVADAETPVHQQGCGRSWRGLQDTVARETGLAAQASLTLLCLRAANSLEAPPVLPEPEGGAGVATAPEGERRPRKGTPKGPLRNSLNPLAGL